MTGRSPSITQRPWGYFEVLAEDDLCKIKRIVVAPRGTLSLQRHREREEHWYLLAGEGVVTLNGVSRLLKAGDSIDIGRGAAHRLGNPGSGEIILIEIQRGESFDEDDIERLADEYGRA